MAHPCVTIEENATVDKESTRGERRNHFIIVTVLLTIWDKLSEARLIMEMWDDPDQYKYAYAFAIAVGTTVLVNFLLVLRFLCNQDPDFNSYLQRERTAASIITILGWLKLDCLQLFYAQLKCFTARFSAPLSRHEQDKLVIWGVSGTLQCTAASEPGPASVGTMCGARWEVLLILCADGCVAVGMPLGEQRVSRKRRALIFGVPREKGNVKV